MKIGDFEVHGIDTGRFALDGGAMFGVVPKTIWENLNPPDEKNRIDLALRTMLVIGKKMALIVDTGIGDKGDEKFKSIFKVRNNEFSWDASLKHHGISAKDITDVVISHLHFDHAGGSTAFSGEKIIPTFPNALFHVQERQYEWALNPSPRDRQSFRKDAYEPLAASGQLKLEKGNYNLAEGIEIFTSEGHTPGQQHVRINSGGKSLIYCADMIPTSAHIPVPYVMGYDNQPVVTAHEKEVFLKQAVSGKWILFFEHDPVIPAAIPVETEKGYRTGEIIEL
jgi:glyoxylase-like metal-dependent hydrolase (beta-lactamase superfamily II)